MRDRGEQTDSSTVPVPFLSFSNIFSFLPPTLCGASSVSLSTVWPWIDNHTRAPSKHGEVFVFLQYDTITADKGGLILLFSFSMSASLFPVLCHSTLLCDRALVFHPYLRHSYHLKMGSIKSTGVKSATQYEIPADKWICIYKACQILKKINPNHVAHLTTYQSLLWGNWATWLKCLLLTAKGERAFSCSPFGPQQGSRSLGRAACRQPKSFND